MIDFMMLFSLWVVGYMQDKCYDVDLFVGGGLHHGSVAYQSQPS
jgi:hypothetical protein